MKELADAPERAVEMHVLLVNINTILGLFTAFQLRSISSATSRVLGLPLHGIRTMWALDFSTCSGPAARRHRTTHALFFVQLPPLVRGCDGHVDAGHGGGLPREVVTI